MRKEVTNNISCWSNKNKRWYNFGKVGEKENVKLKVINNNYKFYLKLYANNNKATIKLNGNYSYEDLIEDIKYFKKENKK